MITYETVETVEGLDALPTATLVRSTVTAATSAQKLSGNLWMFVGDDEMHSSEQMVENGISFAVLYRPDQPTSAAPTWERIAEAGCRAIHGSRWEMRGIDHSCDECKVSAKAIASLYRTCQPSREAVGEAIDKGYYEDDEADGSLAFDGDYALSAVMKLLPGRPEAEVKAEALEEAATGEVSEWARKLVEDQLIELRDSRIGMIRNNGLVCAERDGTPSPIIRLGFEMAWQDCLLVRAEALRGER